MNFSIEIEKCKVIVTYDLKANLTFLSALATILDQLFLVALINNFKTNSNEENTCIKVNEMHILTLALMVSRNEPLQINLRFLMNK
jgi:hypothetical protein